MRRYFFHILAFCVGVVGSSIASCMVWLAVKFGATRFPRMLSLLLHSLNKSAVHACAGLLAVIGVMYMTALAQKETSRFRPNRRYIISAVAGTIYPLFVIGSILTFGKFGAWWRMTSDHKALSVLCDIFGFIFLVSLITRQFISEVEPGLGFCHSCGYDLRMLDATRCPECGQAVVEPVQVTEIRSEADLALLERSRTAIVYLRHPKDPAEINDWVWFVRHYLRHPRQIHGAEFFSMDVAAPAIKGWLERDRNRKMVSEFDRIAFIAQGEVVKTKTSPAHFPNSFKKSSCIGRPSSLLFPYKH